MMKVVKKFPFLKWDKKANVGVLCITNKEVVETVRLKVPGSRMINVDIDNEGEIVAIEVL